MKNDQYFRLNATMMANDSILTLIEELGMEGYGIYIALLGELRQRDDYTCAASSLPALARRWNTGVETVRQVVNNFGLFVPGTDNISFSSSYLNEVMRRLEEKRRQGATGRSVRTVTAQRAANGRFTAANRTEEKSIAEKREKRGEEEPTPASYDLELSPLQAQRSADSVNHWEQYIDEAFADRSWLEVAAMHSGMGLRFAERLPEITAFFKQHVRTYGKEATVGTTEDAKCYFSNFVRPASPTRKALDAELARTDCKHREENPYRYEERDPATGLRSYCGLPIPNEAPPRPNACAVWDGARRQWGR